jgi:hypothetical protein
MANCHRRVVRVVHSPKPATARPLPGQGQARGARRARLWTHVDKR